jgi:carboxypeptidase C (cathepsin A)
VVGAAGSPLPPSPPRLADNPDTWLAFTDLVFIDPVGAGFSRAHEPGSEEEKAFWSVSGDVRSLADVIRRWLADHGRWASPKAMVGESYGGFRAIQIARSLREEHGVAFDGLVLISAAVEFDMIFPSRHAVLAHALALPSLVAAARAHGRGEETMPLAEVERFALEEYLTGITAIAPAGAGPDAALTAEVAGLLGLDPRIVRRFRGRVPAGVFADRLLEDTGLALSLYDGAFAGPDARPGRGGGPDPLLDALTTPLSTLYNVYVREELGVETDLPFRLLNRRPGREWDWEGTRGGGSGDGALDELAETLALTPGLGVLIVHGRTDLVTPYMASAWLIDQLDLPADVRARVSLNVLEGGHMMYLEPGERAALTRLAAEFYARRLEAGAI